MKIYFKTRSQQRKSSITGKRIDCGTTSPYGRRWAVEVPLQRKNNK